jgi:hypothetical protein
MEMGVARRYLMNCKTCKHYRYATKEDWKSYGPNHLTLEYRARFPAIYKKPPPLTCWELLKGFDYELDDDSHAIVAIMPKEEFGCIFHVHAGIKIGFKDKNGKDLRVGHRCRTYDSTGGEWFGTIVPVPTERIVESAIVKAGGIQYGFQSNYITWINNQKYASTLEVIYGEDKDKY